MAPTVARATRTVLAALLAGGAGLGLTACDASSEVPLPAPVSVPAVPPGPVAPPAGGGVVAPPPAADRDDDLDDGGDDLDDGPPGGPSDDGGDDGPDD